MGGGRGKEMKGKVRRRGELEGGTGGGRGKEKWGEGRGGG